MTETGSTGLNGVSANSTSVSEKKSNLRNGKYGSTYERHTYRGTSTTSEPNKDIHKRQSSSTDTNIGTGTSTDTSNLKVTWATYD